MYRQFGKLDFKPSALGFGLMRLPLKDKEKGLVDIDEAVRIVRYAIDNGVNYLDTAYVYHRAESERILSEILKDGYREKVKIATKFPLWDLKEYSDLDRIFFEQLDKLKVKKIDFYLLHALNRERFNLVKKMNIIEWLEKKKADGYIDYIGFSFHDKLSVFKKIIDFYSWDFCQIQYNLVDSKYQAGQSGLKYAHSKGIGVIVMEPLRGGQLTATIPQDIMNLWADLASDYNKNNLPLLSDDKNNFYPTQMLLDWIWSQPEVGLVLSGMSDFEQTRQNILFAKSSSVGKINSKLLTKFRKIEKTYKAKTAINCTACNYCKVCPSKVAIPYIFDLANQIVRFENERSPKMNYNFVPQENRAGKCVNCKICVSHCPQQLDIPALLNKCKQVFEEDKSFPFVFKS